MSTYVARVCVQKQWDRLTCESSDIDHHFMQRKCASNREYDLSIVMVHCYNVTQLMQATTIVDVHQYNIVFGNSDVPTYLCPC
jgi:hypothetical protein